MARGRKRSRAEDAAPAGGSLLQPLPSEQLEARVQEDGAGPAEAPQEGLDRREDMAALARRRAAHFANYKADDSDEDGDQLHAGGKEARKLGPWSSAIQLVEARAAAAAAREDKILEAARGQLEAQEAVAWAPARDVALGPRKACRVDPLFSLSLSLIVDYLEDVETLVGLPDAIKVRLAAAAAKQRKLSPEVARLFTEGGPGEVNLPDCTQLDPETLAPLLIQAASPRLERLELGMCGRGFRDNVATALAGAEGGLRGLEALLLGGAYFLLDPGLEALLVAAPQLQELRLPQCCRITGTGLACLPQCTPLLRILDLEQCRGLGEETLAALFKPDALPALERLTLDGIAEVSDTLLTEAGLALPSLQVLSIRNCTRVTDEGISALAESCPNLQGLSIRRCQKVTDLAVAAVASNGRLQRLCVNNVPSIGKLTFAALQAHCREHLEELDISWCRGIPARALGLLADSCPNLTQLEMWGCSQVTPDFLYGHSNESLKVVGCNLQASAGPIPARMDLLMST
ncbi:hypothetical protein WJX74_006585 [Apatococcus lobatus]|uniref:F-box/LRR-repeat protein 15-like leucin rich repeat domain-containing protein n=2 Tax=Apatococcus TaxID=904362 RepID=A0AAW1SRS2_9CHLO